MKTNYSITKQRQDDLIKAYNTVADKCWTQMQAYEKAVLMPAPRYYISPKQAAQILAPMVRGDFYHVNKMSLIKRKLYYSLYDVVLSLSEKREFFNKPLSYIMKFAVLQPAPQFFVSPRVLEYTRSGLKRGRIDDSGYTLPTMSSLRARARRMKAKAR